MLTHREWTFQVKLARSLEALLLAPRTKVQVATRILALGRQILQPGCQDVAQNFARELHVVVPLPQVLPLASKAS